MKTLLLLPMVVGAVCLSSTAWSQPPAECRPNALNIPNAPYPCVFPDNRVTFRLAAPNGKWEARNDRAAALKKLPSIAGARVLLVDDDEDGRKLVEAMLDQGGAETRSAGSAAEALAILDEQPEQRVAVVAEPGDPAHVTVAIRGVAVGELTIPAERFDGFALLALMQQYGHA